MSEQDKLATKSKDISTALGISNEPVKLNESHVGAIDDLHDAIGETKTSMQTKGNYVSSTHLSSAQRHLKDAKAVLGTKALNTDTKHVLAKAAIGRASASLTNATREAGAPDKARVFGHNSDLKSFVSNPDDAKDFKKYAVNPELPVPSPAELAAVAECQILIDELRQEAATALSYEKDEDKAKELSELIWNLNYKKMSLERGEYTWAKSSSSDIGQATVADLGDVYLGKLENLRVKLHALDDAYPNHY